MERRSAAIAEDPQVDPEVRRREEATWKVAALIRLDREIGRVHKQAALERAAIDEWEQQQVAALNAERAEIQMRLRFIGEQHLQYNRRKSMDLRYGRTQVRLSWAEDRPKLKVTDEEAAVTALRAAGLSAAVITETIPERTVTRISCDVLKDRKANRVIVPDRTQARHGEVLPVVATTGERLDGLAWNISPDLIVKVKATHVTESADTTLAEEGGDDE